MMHGRPTLDFISAKCFTSTVFVATATSLVNRCSEVNLKFNPVSIGR